MNVPLDEEKWSASSKRSYAYDRARISGEFYEDIAYSCIKCAQPSSFTGQERKAAYEVKRTIFGKGGHCAIFVSNAWKILERKIKKRWEQEKAALCKNYIFLCDWLSVLEEIPAFGKRKNESMINMLRRLAHECI